MFERLKWLMPALTLLLAMILLSASSREPGRSYSPLGRLVLEVAGPVERVLTSTARAVEDFFLHYFYLVGLRQENENLRAIVDRQNQQVVQLAEYKAAGDRLTALLGLRSAYPHLVMKSAYVLAWEPSPWFRTIIISVGSSDGIESEQAVVHDTGVVGRVIEVSPNYARVLLATDFNSSIDAFVQRTRAVGILSGEGSDPMSLKYVRKDEDVRPGDQVVTSGLDGFFPRGLALGLVSRVNRQSADMFSAVEITPAVTFDRLEEVMVIVNQGPPMEWLSPAPDPGLWGGPRKKVRAADLKAGNDMPVMSPVAAVIFGPRDFLKVLALGLILVLVQGSLAAWLGLIGFWPEWILVLAVYVALRADLWAAALASFFLGLLRDILGGSLWGLHSLTLILLIWLFHPYRARLNFFSPLALAPLIFFLSVGGDLFIMTPVVATLGWPSPNFNPLPGFFISSGVTAVTAPPLFLLLERLTKNKDPRNA